MADEPITGLPGDDNVRESIEFEPILKMDLIESQLDKVRSQIENAFSYSNFDPTRSLPTGFQDPIGGIQNTGESLLKASQNIVNSFMSAPETISREMGYVNNGFNSLTRDVKDLTSFDDGYNWRAPYSRTEYEGARDKKSSKAFGEFFTDNAGTAIGMAAGSLIPGLGTVAGAVVGTGIGYAFDAVVGEGIERERAINKLTKNFKRTATDDANVNISTNTANELASGIYDKVESFEGKAQNITMDEILGNISTFKNAGGFKKVNSAEEFKSTVTSVIEDTREISKTLGMFQDEVVTLMAELKNKGIANVSESKELLTGIQAQASSSGINTRTLIQQGFNAAQAFGGTRFGASNAFNFGIDAYSETKRLYDNNDDLYGAGINRQGGVAAASKNLVQDLSTITARNGMSHFYNQQTGGAPTGDPFKLMRSGVDYFSKEGVQGIFASYDREQEAAGKISLVKQAQNQVEGAIAYMDIFNLRGEDGVYSADEISGRIAKATGLSRDRADNIVGVALNANQSGDIKNKLGGQIIQGMQISTTSLRDDLSTALSVGWDVATLGPVRRELGKEVQQMGEGIGKGYLSFKDFLYHRERFTDEDLTDRDKENIKKGINEELDKEARNTELYKTASKKFADIINASNIDISAYTVDKDGKPVYDASRKEQEYISENFFKNLTMDDLNKIAFSSKSSEELIKNVTDQYTRNNASDVTNKMVNRTIATIPSLRKRFDEFGDINILNDIKNKENEAYIESRKNIDEKNRNDLIKKISGEEGLAYFEELNKLSSQSGLVGDERIDAREARDTFLKQLEEGTATDKSFDELIDDNYSSGSIYGMGENNSKKFAEHFKEMIGPLYDKVTTSNLKNSLKEKLYLQGDKNMDYFKEAAASALLQTITSGQDVTISKDANFDELFKGLTGSGTDMVKQLAVAVGNDEFTDKLNKIIDTKSFFDNHNINMDGISNLEKVQAEYYANISKVLTGVGNKTALRVKEE